MDMNTCVRVELSYREATIVSDLLDMAIRAGDITEHHALVTLVVRLRTRLDAIDELICASEELDTPSPMFGAVDTSQRGDDDISF